MSPNSLLYFATICIGYAAGAPYLQHLYQPLDSYVYLNPNPVVYQPYQQVFGIQPYQHQSYQQHLISPITTQQQFYQVNNQGVSEKEELPEMNQFHSEDAEGRVLYGFHGHNQARMEARDSQGRVRGSYSYLDPRGHVVRMDYWDDGTGFQARGNHIPKPVYDFPEFTPEVQAAREQHFKLYQQILLSTVHARPPPNKVQEHDYAYVERPDGVVATPIGQQQEDQDDTVEVGLVPNQPEELPSYPGSMRIPGEIPQSPFPFQDQNEEDLESIALDNPEFQDLGRSGKSLESKDTKQEGSNNQDKVQKLDKDDEKKTEKTQEKTTDKKSSDKNDKKTSEEKEMNKEDVHSDISDKHNGFSYHFQYTLPTEPKIQPVINFAKVSSVVASEPVPKDRKTSLHAVHPLPLHTMTNTKNDMAVKNLPAPSAYHDVQVAPHQSMLQRPLVIKSFVAPVSAVHDSQVPLKKINKGKTESAH